MNKINVINLVKIIVLMELNVLQDDIAKIVGVSSKTISQWKNKKQINEGECFFKVFADICTEISKRNPKRKIRLMGFDDMSRVRDAVDNSLPYIEELLSSIKESNCNKDYSDMMKKFELFTDFNKEKFCEELISQISKYKESVKSKEEISKKKSSNNISESDGSPLVISGDGELGENNSNVRIIIQNFGNIIINSS